MKKTHLASAVAIALGSLSFNVSAEQICIGQNPVVDTIVENVNQPQLEIQDHLTELQEGETLLLSALATIDTQNNASANFYWCTDKGLLNALANPSTTDAIANPSSTDLSTVDAIANIDSIDFSSIEFTAPAVAEQGDKINIGIKLSDGLGYFDYKIIELQINDSGNTDEDDPAPTALIDTPDNMTAGTENTISFFVSDENKDGDDSSDKLSTDLYYRIDDGDFQVIERNIIGAADRKTWTPDQAGEYQLKIISSDGNKQTEALSNRFSVDDDNSSLRKLLEDIVVNPVDDAGDPIVGGQIEIVINAEIVIIFDDDNDGQYQLPATREGDYEIQVRQQDRTYPTETIRLQAMPDADNNDNNVVTARTQVQVVMQQAPVIDTVTISPRDDQGNIIISATIEIVINGELVSITDEDGDGRYQVPNIAEGRHEVRIQKGNYIYPTTEVIIDSDTNADTPVEPQAPAPFQFDDNNAINTENLIVLGAYACDENSIYLIDSQNKEVFHSFNADLEGRGIYINPVDFDRDGLVDIASGGINQGRDMLIYNSNREIIGRIISNGDDQGVLIAFGDVDADSDFEIMVTNQSADNTVNLYESDGTAVRALGVLQGNNRINIATGDVDGDGVDELIVVRADNANTDADNVMIFDENGNLINSFKAVPNPDIETRGLTVTVGDVNGDGKDEIIIAESQTQQNTYGVAVYSNDGELQSQFNAFSGSDGAQNPVASKCGNAFPSSGLLLSTGDINGDGKADIIVARAGYRQVKLFDGNGEFIDWLNALPEGYQITALGYGGRMNVRLPETRIEDIEDDNTPLENITVIGQPDQPRPVINNREIRGTVRVANVLIINISIRIGAHLIPGPGTRFINRQAIPEGLDLTPMCRTVQQAPNDNASKVPEPIEVIDLSEPVVDEASTVLEDIRVLVGDDANADTRRGLSNFGLRRAGNIQLVQDPSSGLLQARQGNTLIELMPTELRQAGINAAAGISVEDNGTAYITTRQGQVVTVQAALHDLDTFINGLEQYGTVDRLETDSDGQLRLFYTGNSNVYHVGRPHFYSEALGDRNLAVGLYEASVLFPNVNQGIIFVFDDNLGVRRWQLILPTPADRAALLALAETDNSIDAIQLHFDGAANTIPGSISFQTGGQTYQAIFDYIVRKGATPASGGVEINRVDDSRYEVIYPNGDHQYLFLIK